jgi:hypothetical protein
MLLKIAFAGPRTDTPTPVLPAMTLRAAAVVPPMTLPPEPAITTPSALPAAVVPVRSVPMKLPSIVLPPPKPITIPLPGKRLTISPRTVVAPPVISSACSFAVRFSPLSSTLITALLPSVAVFGLAPGCV